MKTLKQVSRQDWSVAVGDGASREEIMLGCVQRIADALDRLSPDDFTNRVQYRVNLERWYESEKQKSKALRREVKLLKAKLEAQP